MSDGKQSYITCSCMLKLDSNFMIKTIEYFNGSCSCGLIECISSCIIMHWRYKINFTVELRSKIRFNIIWFI